jgi:hypothetical protein
MEDSGKEACAYDIRMKRIDHAPTMVGAPVTYRIETNGQIGNREYSCLGAAKDSAIEHGKNGETFSVWEVRKIADYRVKTTTELEHI